MVLSLLSYFVVFLLIQIKGLKNVDVFVSYRIVFVEINKKFMLLL